MSTQISDHQEFTQLQNERQEDAEYMAQVRDLNDDKWGLTYVKTQTRQGLQNAKADPDETITHAHKRNRAGHKEVANGSPSVRRGVAGR